MKLFENCNKTQSQGPPVDLFQLTIQWAIPVVTVASEFWVSKAACTNEMASQKKSSQLPFCVMPVKRESNSLNLEYNVHGPRRIEDQDFYRQK